jgi:anti-anti-sigma factor
MALLQVKTFPDVTVATLTATSLDELNADLLGQELSDLAGRLGGRELHLDLGGVQVLTSIGLAKLVCLHKQVQAAGGRLSLLNVRPEIYEVFAATRLNGLLDVQPAPEGGATLSESA